MFFDPIRGSRTMVAVVLNADLRCRRRFRVFSVLIFGLRFYFPSFPSNEQMRLKETLGLHSTKYHALDRSERRVAVSLLPHNRNKLFGFEWS